MGKVKLRDIRATPFPHQSELDRGWVVVVVSLHLPHALRNLELLLEQDLK